jgi:hypothetical protein
MADRNPAILNVMFLTMSDDEIVNHEESFRLLYRPCHFLGSNFSSDLPSGCGTSNRTGFPQEISTIARTKKDLMFKGFGITHLVVGLLPSAN